SSSPAFARATASRPSPTSSFARECSRRPERLLRYPSASAVQRGQDARLVRHPAEDPALGLDHLQAHLVKLGEVRAAGVGGDDAAITAIVGLAHSGVDADLGGHAADEQVLYSAVGQDRLQVGGI